MTHQERIDAAAEEIHRDYNPEWWPTGKMPTESGRFYQREDEEDYDWQIVRVADFGKQGLLVWTENAKTWKPVTEVGGQWAGPIREPQERKVPMTAEHAGIYDDSDSDRGCGGTGMMQCQCGGDQCVCYYHGEYECPGCEDCEQDEDYGEDCYD